MDIPSPVVSTCGTPSAGDRADTGLRGSIAATAALDIVGVAWGIISGSQMIVPDGVHAVIGIATSALLLRASGLAVRGLSRSYPFGRESATPLVIGIQGFILLATLLRPSRT